MRSEELGQSSRKPASADGDLLNASLKASCSPQEKPHASPVDRRVSLMDSLKASREMAARPNGMDLARNQPRLESIREKP